MSTDNSLLSAVPSIATAVAAYAAGAWALYNFGIRRIAKARVHLAITLLDSEKTEDGRWRVYVAIEASNHGNTKVKISQSYLRLAFINVLADTSGASKLQPLAEYKTYPVFRGHTFLEPGEVFREDCALHVTQRKPLQLDLEFLGDKPNRSWTTSRIINFSHEPKPAPPAGALSAELDIDSKA